MDIAAKTVEPNHILLFTQGCMCAPTAPPIFSRKHAKLLAIHAHRLACISVVFPGLERRVASETFWSLLTRSQAPVNDDLRELHFAVAIFLFREKSATSQPSEMQTKLLWALQAAAAALRRRFTPRRPIGTTAALRSPRADAPPPSLPCALPHRYRALRCCAGTSTAITPAFEAGWLTRSSTSWRGRRKRLRLTSTSIWF